MEQTALYHLIKQARNENKAIKLLPNTNSKDLGYEIIIEPTHKVENKNDNIISIKNGLVDLNFIAAALIIPNRDERLKEKQEKLDKLYKEVYKSHPKGKRGGV